MNGIIQDLKYALRMLRKNPGFTIVAVLTLALGIGANTAIFSVVNGLLLHPAGIPHPERLVAIRVRYEKLNLKSIVVSATDFADVRNSRDVFAAAAAEQNGSLNFTSGDTPERLRTSKVSAQWFDVFESRPILGRTFTNDEDQPHADHEVVLSNSAWKSFFGADGTIVGRSIQLNQEPYRVIGVMGPKFQWPPLTDIWVPLALAPGDMAEDNRFNEGAFVVARLQLGVSFSRAAAYMDVLTQHVANDHNTPYAKSSGWGMFAVPLTEFVYGDVRTPLLVLLGAVGFVLLIACANVAGLLLARASGRSKEFAVRVALGASPWRLARQTLTESFAVTAIGTGLGLLFGAASIRALMTLGPEELANAPAIPMDRFVLLFTVAAAAIATLVVGAAPAWQIARMNPQQNLKEGRGGGLGSRARHRFRNVLVVGQLALSLVLLAGAGLFLKSLSKLQEVNVGFRPHGLMTAAAALPDRQYDTPAKQIIFCRSVLEKLSSVPGVISAAAAYPLPFSGFNASASFEVEGRPAPPGDPGPHGDLAIVSPGYFSTLGVPLLRGRSFTDQDREGGAPVFIIDENLARMYWPNEDPVGKRMRRNSSDPWATIVGVVAATRHSQVAGEEASSEGVEGAGKGVYFYPVAQLELPFSFLIVRTDEDAGGLVNGIREAVRSVDPNQPISDAKTMDQRIAMSLGPRRSAVVLLGVFAIMAVMLSAIGLFGLVRYSVVQRTQEIGVRMALGATPADVLRMILGEGLRLALVGVGVGLIAALALTRVLRTLLYGVSAADPATYATVAILLVGVALAASWLPAMRATHVDPIEALRYE
ncbi:MAG: ABC transporter permease [Candidatus Acidiferrales bacterium]